MALDSCSVCGGGVARTARSAPEIVCQRCRRERREVKLGSRWRCEWCGGDFVLKYRRSGGEPRFCSRACKNRSAMAARKGQSKRPAEDTRRSRQERETAAPGLRWRERRRLLRPECAYCGGLATTIDHVVPLSRGGTNFEGNLVSACRRCNSAKCDRLLIEWRTGRKAGQSVSPQASWLREACNES